MRDRDNRGYRYRLTNPPKALLKTRLDNIAIVPASMLPLKSRNHARMPHCLRWGGMASLLGGLGDRFPQHNRALPSKSPAACGGDLYSAQRGGTRGLC